MNSTLDQFNDKQVVFIGLGQGRSAKGIQSYLEKNTKMAGFDGVNQDNSNPDKPWEFLKDYPAESTIFIKNEGVPGHQVPVDYIAPVQLFFELLKPTSATTIGITGTKGKSTTTSLVASMLEKSGIRTYLCGNIGTSVFTYLDKASKDTIFVVELSSYQLSDLTISPHISVCINLYFDHVDWHGSKEAYWEAKHNIMRFAGKDDYFVYNPDFPALKQWAESGSCHMVEFSSVELVDMSRSKLIGDHNKLNVLAARTAAKLAGAEDDAIQTAIDEFEPLHHRLETVAKKSGVTYVDDGIATTPEATLAAISAVTTSIGPVRCLMLGGDDRGYDFSELIGKIREINLPNLVLFPPSGERIMSELPEPHKLNVLQTRDMVEAVQFAANNVKDGVVLLSTASPSYSIWPNGFEQKGQEFSEAIAKLS
jgi:UDP-N-acetylmuramoylalanine--D-glutamate ligase